MFYFYSLATKDVLHYGEQSEELAELKRMVSLLIKRDTATRDNHEPLLPEGINFPLGVGGSPEGPRRGFTKQGCSKGIGECHTLH